MIQYKGISALEILEEAKNYNKWIVEQFLHHIKTPLLEVGSGTGNISAFFSQKKNVTISDIDKGLVENLKKKFSKQTSFIIKKIDISGPIAKDEINKYQSIIGINVLEHIQDDRKALSNIHRMLKKNGKILLLVPAKKIAYTRLDKSIGHFRRYEKNELKEKLEDAGFSIERLYFFNFVGLFSWTIRDKIERGHHMKPYQVALFDKIVPLLKKVENIIKPFVGISLIAIAKKK